MLEDDKNYVRQVMGRLRLRKWWMSVIRVPHVIKSMQVNRVPCRNNIVDGSAAVWNALGTRYRFRCCAGHLVHGLVS